MLALPTYDLTSFDVRNTDLLDSHYPLSALVFTGSLEISPTVHSRSRGFGTNIVTLLAVEYIMSSTPSSIICEYLTFFYLLPPIGLTWPTSAFYGMVDLLSSLPHGSGADALLEY